MTIPLPVIAATFRVAAKWHDSASGLNAVNVMHFRSGVGTATPAQLNAALHAHGTSSMFLDMAATTQLTGFDILPLDGVSSTQSFGVGAPDAWGGAAAGEAIPQVCYLIKLQTGLRGRNNRGRIYVPYPTEAVVSKGQISSSDAGSISTGWTNFQAAMTVATPVTFSLGVASYDRAHNGAGAHFNPALTLVCETFTATQRRRQPGRKVARH